MERNENGLSVLFEGQRGSARDMGRGAPRGEVGGVTQGGTSGGGCSDSRDRTQQNGCRGMAGNGCMGRYPSGEGVQLAMVYAPLQCFRMTYAPEAALMRGTLFEELDKPLEEY